MNLKVMSICIIVMISCSTSYTRQVLKGEMLWTQLQLVTETGFDFAITQNQISGGLTLTKPGRYALAQDINVGANSITIGVNGVELDLNGKTLTGSATAIVVNDVSDFILKNGIITSSNSTAVSVISAFNVYISNVIIQTGHIDVTSTSNFQLNACQFINLGSPATAFLSITSSQIGKILNSIFTGGATTNGIALTSSEEYVFDNIELSLNTLSTGFLISSSTRSIFNNIRINKNADSTDGMYAIRLVTSTQCDFTQCFINSNVSSAGEFFGISAETGSSDCTFNGINIWVNSGINTLSGIQCISTTTTQQDIQIADVKMYDNVATGTLNGILINSVQASNIDFFNCYSNKATTTLYGVILENAINCNCLNSIIQGNTVTVAGGNVNGIFIDSTATECDILKNIVDNNTAAGGVAFGLVNNSTTATVFNNIVGDHATANFTGTSVPRVTFTRSTGVFSATPTPYDNINLA